MLESINKLDVRIQSAIISGIVSVFVLIVGWVIKFLFERYSISFKLKKEYYYEQRKKIKEIFVITKTPLLKAAEDVNFRLHNLKSTILENNWLDVTEEEWCNPDRYYLHSTVYRFSVLFHWLLEVEKSLYSLDTVNAERHDKKYIKYIKALRQILTDNRLLTELGYKESDKTNHFYANEISKYAKMCLNDKGDVIDFEEFVELFYADCKKYNKFIGFFTNVKNEEDNKNYNSLKCMHILIIDFLNKFGHEYQKTKWKKYKKLLNNYKGIKIKKGYLHFLDRNKMLSEMKKPLRIIGMGFTFRMENRYY